MLFIGAVTAIPSDRRSWGATSWMADVFGISRVSVFALGERIKQRMQAPSQPIKLLFGPTQAVDTQTITVAPNRLARTILTETRPGDVSIRPTQAILRDALDPTRCVDWISQLRLDAGRQAGRVFSQIDTSPLGPLIVIRDETFFQGHPILMVVDPLRTTILLALACSDRQADTWGWLC